MGGSFPIDILLFGMIAAFLVLRLRSILGRREGFERTATPQPRPGAPGTTPGLPDATAEPAAISRELPDPASPAGLALSQMQRLDRGFAVTRFLEGAEAAFPMIVGAFAAGDREALRPLLSDDTFAAFDGAIAAREAAGHRQRTEVRRIVSTALTGAGLRGNVASLAVRFITDQINVTTDTNGTVVSGSDAVTEITDVWTFERDLSSRDPTWRLVAASSA